MKDLLPPNASRTERAVDAASARIDELPVPLRDLWNPWKCPLALLPWLAATLGVETWDPGWPEAVKRRFCAEAFGVHREKGTPAALKRVLGLAGAVFNYAEGPDAEAELAAMQARVSILNSESIALDSIDSLRAALERHKRASVHLQVEALAGFRAETVAAAGFGALQVARFGSEGATA
ncbi:MAG: phage tail protein I [Bryobacterales bacterium]|nr:phage tail protein I [Bryobacterales bacterium]